MKRCIGDILTMCRYPEKGFQENRCVFPSEIFTTSVSGKNVVE